MFENYLDLISLLIQSKAKKYKLNIYEEIQINIHIREARSCRKRLLDGTISNYELFHRLQVDLKFINIDGKEEILEFLDNYISLSDHLNDYFLKFHPQCNPDSHIFIQINYTTDKFNLCRYHEYIEVNLPLKLSELPLILDYSKLKYA